MLRLIFGPPGSLRADVTGLVMLAGAVFMSHGDWLFLDVLGYTALGVGLLALATGKLGRQCSECCEAA